MSVTSVSHVALPSFEEFINGTSPDELKNVKAETPVCLADFIEAWVRSGYGVYACNGDHETYLGVVIAIIELWVSQPDLLDYVPSADSEQLVVERRVTSIFGDDGTDHRILDRDFFATWKFRWLHGAASTQ